MVTFDRTVKKDAFYWYKANWNKKEPVVYISSRRYTTRPNTQVTVKIYSNCPEVTLKVNGTTIGTKTSTDCLFVWEALTMNLGANQIEASGVFNNVTVTDNVTWTCENTIPIPVFPEVPAGQIQINFQKVSTTATPTGYLKDDGTVYADKGNGYSYGWNTNLTANNRERMVATDKRFDTFMQMQTTANSSWSIALPNQWYKVSIACGDPNYFDSYNKIEANGVVIVDYLPTNANKFGAGTAYTKVTNGTMIVKPATGSTNAKINFIHITPVTEHEATSVKQIGDKKKVNIFVQNKKLNIENSVGENEKLEIYSVSGQLLLSKTGLPKQAIVPLSALPNGVYFVKIKSGNEWVEMKIAI